MEGTRAEDGATYRTPPVRGETTEAATSEAPAPELAIAPKVLGTPAQALDPPEPEPAPSGQETPKAGLPPALHCQRLQNRGYIGLLNLPNNPKAKPKPEPPFRGFKAPPGDLRDIAKARQAAEAAKAKQIVRKGNTYWIQALESSTPEEVARELEARARIYGSEVPDDFNSPPKPTPSAPPDNLARPHSDRPRNDSVDRNLAYHRAEEERVVQERQQAWRETTASERTRAWQQEVDQAAREGRQIHSPASAKGAASSAPSGSASSRQPSETSAQTKSASRHQSWRSRCCEGESCDWHGVLDVDLTPLGTITSQGRRYFQQISTAAQGRVEFHILSFCGKAAAAANQANIDHFILDAVEQGIPFRSGSIKIIFFYFVFFSGYFVIFVFHLNINFHAMNKNNIIAFNKNITTCYVFRNKKHH